MNRLIRNLTILLVDDDEHMRTLVGMYLKKAGDDLGVEIKILSTPDVDTAWKLWRQNQGDIHGIITDMILTGPITGMEFLMAISKDGTLPVPAIILTGLTDEYNMDRMWEVAQVINKPIPPHFDKMCAWWLTQVQTSWITRQALLNHESEQA